MNKILQSIIAVVIAGLLLAIGGGIFNNWKTVNQLEVTVTDLKAQMNGRLSGIQDKLNDTNDRVDTLFSSKRDK